MIPPGFTWRTNDGRVLDIRWMDSTHLVNSFNMLCRKHSLTLVNFEQRAPVSRDNILGNMADELRARGYFEWTPQFNQIAVPKTRESKQVLCMFRALVDHAMPETGRQMLGHFGSVNEFLERFDVPGVVVASFAAYRLERP